MFYPVFLVLVMTSSSLASHVSLQYGEQAAQHSEPYNYQYNSGHYPGHVDQVQKQSSYGSGVMPAGTYLPASTYVDPKQNFRTVDYNAHRNGYNPHQVNYGYNQQYPQDTEAVRLAKQYHHGLYQRIADYNSQAPRETLSVARATDNHLALYKQIAAEHAAIGAEREPPQYRNRQSHAYNHDC